MLIMALMIAGNLLGAGLLGLPIKTGPAGFFPSLLVILSLGIGMFFTSMVLSREVIKRQDKTFNYPSLYQFYLGEFGKWVAILTNLLILYGVLTAYITGATTVIVNMLPFEVPPWVVTSVFFVFVTSISSAGINVIKKWNAWIILLTVIFFMIILYLGLQNVHLEYLSHSNLFYLPVTIPVIITSFLFHNIIPSICHNLKNKMSTIWKTVLLGIFISVFMSVFWNFIAIGSIPFEGGDFNMKLAIANNWPATIPLSKIIQSPLFVFSSFSFTLLILVAPYITNGVAIANFMEDLVVNQLGRSKHPRLIWLLSYSPPLLVSLISPNIFLKTLDIVGGIGIVTLFGLLPSLIYTKQKWNSPKKFVGLFFLTFFLICLIFELAQEFGLLQISPDLEYWKVNLGILKIFSPYK